MTIIGVSGKHMGRWESMRLIRVDAGRLVLCLYVLALWLLTCRCLTVVLLLVYLTVSFHMFILSSMVPRSGHRDSS